MMAVSTTRRIAIIGGGPAAVYLLRNLGAARRPLDVTIFEASTVAGRGTPYHPDTTDTSMLCNISSAEFPPVLEPLHLWLARQSDSYLARYEIERGDISDKVYYPRLVLGDYFEFQFADLAARMLGSGHTIDIRTHHEVTDIVPYRSGAGVMYRTNNDMQSETFDLVVLATGHTALAQQPDHQVKTLIPSPYPFRRLHDVEGGDIGILGTSLSAVDAMSSIARRFGEFESCGDGLRYTARDASPPFHLTMMSRKGLLPEIDFYHPVPFEPLRVFTDAAISLLIEQGAEGLFEKTFALFKAELLASETVSGSEIRSSHALAADSMAFKSMSVEQFHGCYFKQRMESDPIDWARRTLEQARLDYGTKTTDRFKYAILRMHETFERIVEHLDERDTFRTFLKPVFVDNYAALPHESIARILALHEAGHLKVVRLADNYHTNVRQDGVTITGVSSSLEFDVVIDARGQKTLDTDDLPFPILAASLYLPSLYRAGEGWEEITGEKIRTNDDFKIISDAAFVKGIYLMSAPFLLDDLPFCQGLEPLHQISEVIADAILTPPDRVPVNSDTAAG